MWKPDQSLDDYVVSPAPEVTTEPPRSVSLRRTGEVEVVKPLIRPEVRTKRLRTRFRAVPLQPLWFRRFLAVGNGVLAMTALVLVSAILVGINDPVEGPEVATSGMPVWEMIRPQEPFSFNIFSPATSAPATREAHVLRSYGRRRPAAPRVRLTAIKPTQQVRPALQAEEPEFVPTTLVIYAENGVINTHIEPWFPAADKKTQTFSN